jgi:hypothetical protein
MQPTQPFFPWAWRDPAGVAGGFDRSGTSVSDEDSADSATRDEQANADLSGYKVEATDGSIGAIDEASYEVGSAYVVVDTGPWIFGRKVLLPAGTIDRIDHADRRVYVDQTKDQIKDSPDYDEDTSGTPEYRQRVGDYYTDIYRQSSALR